MGLEPWTKLRASHGSVMMASVNLSLFTDEDILREEPTTDGDSTVNLTKIILWKEYVIKIESECSSRIMLIITYLK